MGICQDMIPVAPEEGNFALEGSGVEDFDSQPGVGIAPRPPGFIEAVGYGRFEIIFLDIGLNGAGIHGDGVSGDDLFIHELPDQKTAESLKLWVVCLAQETGEAFDRGRRFPSREAEEFCDNRIILQLKSQLTQRGKPAEILVDERPEESGSGKGGTTSGFFQCLGEKRQ